MGIAIRVRRPRPGTHWWVVPKGQPDENEDAEVWLTQLPARDGQPETYKLVVRAITQRGREEASDIPPECTAAEFFDLVLSNRLVPVDRDNCWQ